MKYILLLITAFVTLKAQQQNHLELGTPTNSKKSDLIINRFVNDTLLYVIGYNQTLRVPNWVSWNLSKDWYGEADRYSGNFITDVSVDDPAKHTDYTNSGYSRGHMVRSEERTRSDAQNRATFFMTNILPQYQDLNGGPWLDLEYYCEDLCKKQNKELYIISGGIHSSGKLINNRIGVPDTCFKIIVILEKGQGLNDVNTNTKVIAVKMPNVTGISGEFTQYTCSIDDIESSTGYDYLNKVSTDIQKVIESKIATSIKSDEPKKKEEKNLKLIDILGRPWVGEYEWFKEVGEFKIVR